MVVKTQDLCQIFDSSNLCLKVSAMDEAERVKFLIRRQGIPPFGFFDPWSLGYARIHFRENDAGSEVHTVIGEGFPKMG